MGVVEKEVYPVRFPIKIGLQQLIHGI